MKRIILSFAIVFIALFSVNAQERASLTISNTSNYTLTVKVMKQMGGLHATLYIPPQQSRTTYFSSTGYFYTKTKAEKSGSFTLYKKDESCFKIVCDSRGYSEAVMSFYVSEHGCNAGESISRAEFEKNDR